MKITILVNAGFGGGAERDACNLANALSECHNVTLLTVTDRHKTYSLDAAVNVLALKEETPNTLRKLALIPGCFAKLRNYIRNSQTGLYIIYLKEPFLMFTLYHRYVKVPVIRMESSNPEAYSGGWQRFLKSASRFVDRVVFQTAGAMDWYGESVRDKGVVIPNALSESFLSVPLPEQRRKRIVAVGRLEKMKRHDLMITVFSEIKDLYPDYTLEIYGEGSERNNLEALIRNKNLDDRVFLHGSVSDIAGQINDASLFIHFSEYEGMPNAVLEALALGLPVVATDCPAGGVADLIKDHENGLLVPVNDQNAMKQAICFMLDHSDAAEAMGEKARKVRETNNPDVIYSRWNSLINEVVAHYN